jgi:hypothetical protein
MSSGAGSFVFAFFCAQRRMALSWAIASSRAAIDFCRPTKSGTTMCGKTMMSRRGSSGRVRGFFPSFLPSSLREKMGTVGGLLARRVAAPRALEISSYNTWAGALLRAASG